MFSQTKKLFSYFFAFFTIFSLLTAEQTTTSISSDAIIDAAFLREANQDDWLIFIGTQWVRWDSKGDKINNSGTFSHNWFKRLPEPFSKGIDAALCMQGKREGIFFSGDKWIHWNLRGDKPIKQGDFSSNEFKNLPESFKQYGIDAAILRKKGNMAYLFSQDKWLRWDLAANKPVKGPYNFLSHAWFKNLKPLFDKSGKNQLDAAVSRAGGDAAYFFSGDWWVRWNLKEDKITKGPEELSHKWFKDLNNYIVRLPRLTSKLIGKTVRIKSLRNNKYYAARKMSGIWRLRADGKKNEAATIFKVLNKDEWIALQSDVADGNNLNSAPSTTKNRVKYEVSLLNKNFGKNEQWKIEGRSLNRCWLKNHATGSYLCNPKRNFSGGPKKKKLGENVAWTKYKGGIVKGKPAGRGNWEKLAIEVIFIPEEFHNQAKKETQLLDDSKKQGKISLYLDVIEKVVTDDFSLSKKFELVNQELVPLVNAALKDEQINKNINHLQKIISLLNKAIGKISQGLTNAQKQPLVKTLNEKITNINNQIENLQQSGIIKSFKSEIEKVDAISNYSQRLAAYEKMKAKLFFRTEHQGVFMATLDKLLEERQPNQLTPLGNMIQNLIQYINGLIDIIEGKNPFVSQDKIDSYTKLSKEELINTISILQEKKSIASKPVAFKELIDKANSQLSTAVANPSTKVAWLSLVTYLANNLAGKPESEITAVKTLAESIDGALDTTNPFTKEWREKLSATEQTKLKATIKKINAYVPAKETTTQTSQAKTPEVAPEKPLTFNDTLADVKTTLLQDTVNQSATSRKAWLDNFGFLVKNKIGQSIENLEELKKLIADIQENYIAFPLWYNEFSNSEKAQLRQYIRLGEKPIDYSLVLSQAYKSLQDGSNIKTTQAKTMWLNQIKYLIANKQKLSANNLETLERIMTTAEKWTKFRSWIKKFNDAEQKELAILISQATAPAEEKSTEPTKPIDFKALLSQAKENIRKAFSKGPDQEKWLQNVNSILTDVISRTEVERKEIELFSADINKYMNLFATDVQETLKNLLAKGEVDYLKIATALKDEIRNVLVKSPAQDMWLKKLTYLVNNMKEKSPEELNGLKNLVDTIKKFIELFPEEMQTKLKPLIKKATIVPSYKKVFETAQKATTLIDKEGTKGKITLYMQALDAITKDVSQANRIEIIKNHLIPLAKEVLEDKTISKDIEVLKTITTLFTKAKGKLSENLSESGQKEINNILEAESKKIADTITQITQTGALQAFTKKLDNAKSKSNYKEKITAFKDLLEEAATSPEKKGLYMTEINTLINTRKPDEITELVGLLDHMIGSAQYNPQIKGTFSLDALNAAKVKASKPIEYKELIDRASAAIANATESAKTKTAWIKNLTYLVDNIEGQPEADIAKVKTLFSETIQNNLKYNTSWAGKFTDSEKTTITSLITKLTKTAKAEIKAQEQAVKKAVSEARKSPAPKPKAPKRRIRR